jgi:hypothetical protein
MPDLQTELSKVLNTWNQPENVVQSETKPPRGDGSVGRAVFDLIKANPGLTIEEYEEMGRSQGLQVNSTRNYILLFCKATWRLASNTDGAITLLSPEYKTRVEMLGFRRGARGSKVERARNKAMRELRAARKQAAEAEIEAEVAPAESPRSKSWLRDALVAYVSANQGCSRMDVIRALTEQGMNEGSIVATLNTAVRKGHLVSVHGLVWTPQARQEERNNHNHLAQIEQLVKELEQQHAKEQKEARKAAAALAAEKQNEVDIDNMTVREARVLFDKLRHLFGPQA